ncbi:MAG: hypothetical protein BRD50_08695 [Bacteroidetes bacterium SW_11_45_7]|nr:MAG: hypothetical protein BRD50_08695 [Bacteroidetes bacterium SW_11_45_7]
MVDSGNITCNGACDGSAAVAPSGGTPGYSYTWDNGATDSSLTNLCPGTYSVTITDANGCRDSAEVTIAEPPVLTSQMTDSTNASCNGDCNGSGTVTPTGGTPPYSFTWDNGETDSIADSLCAGLHKVTITDTNSCTTTDSVTITEPPVLTVSVTDTSNLSCYGDSNGTATVTPAGGTPGYDYAWSGGDNPNDSVNTGIPAGQFEVTVTDTNGCNATDTFPITEPPQLTLSFTDTTNVSCNGGSDGAATVTPSGGTSPYSFNWGSGTGNSPSDSANDGLAAGTYPVTVTDDNSCTAVDSITITEPPVLQASMVDSGNITCNGACDGSAAVAPSGGTPGYSYNWSNGSTDSTISGVCPGAYSVTTKDANGCQDSAQVTITEPPVLAATIVDTTHLLCYEECNGSASLGVTGGTYPYSFNWGNGETEV